MRRRPEFQFTLAVLHKYDIAKIYGLDVESYEIPARQISRGVGLGTALLDFLWSNRVFEERVPEDVLRDILLDLG